VALIRHFGPRNDAERLPVFPVLLGDTAPEELLAFLRLPQAIRWDGTSPLANELVDQIRERKVGKANTVPVPGCPFVGLAPFAPKHARLFFGRPEGDA
jgi:hypothetical protein